MNTNYPDYYKVVNIQYSKDSHSIKAGRAWLAINDNGHRIWTIDNSNEVLSDNEIISWWY